MNSLEDEARDDKREDEEHGTGVSARWRRHDQQAIPICTAAPEDLHPTLTGSRSRDIPADCIAPRTNNNREIRLMWDVNLRKTASELRHCTSMQALPLACDTEFHMNSVCT